MLMPSLAPREDDKYGPLDQCGELNDVGHNGRVGFSRPACSRKLFACASHVSALSHSDSPFFIDLPMLGGLE
jgi:hypothetical protein